ncbi:dCTP deaminase domain-containing protein [Nocardia sp. NPDC051570]|uniref:dCTP deaminase domain-containing protein n=1 Tax=Nocardia sp. NPDC051570 TaxID=3364324 RepID=UPI0037B1EA3B
MILTGSEIEREWTNGRITIAPFVPEQVNPNSYNFRLGDTLRVYRDVSLDARNHNEFDEIHIPEEGYVLEPGRLYLAHTIEVLGSDHYAPTFAARSSVARLGMFINLSASLGDIGYKGQWTLQLYTLNRVRVYAGINIGQMMWWRPQGEVVLYDGKYQGSTGPRSSDIHVDFDKQIARQRFPGLGATADAGEVGPKFAALAQSSRQFQVPPAFCVPAGELADAMTVERRDALADAFADLRATVGAFFTESAARIHQLGGAVRVPDQARALLRTRMVEVFGAATGQRFAVRSSGLAEDTVGSSLAGIHHSVLDVEGLDGVVTAIEQCWASYYQTPAVAARVRAGDFDSTPRLAVIVQAMVQPRLAGVAFTGLTPDDREQVALEYVEGLADQLVAGIAVPRTATSDALSQAPESDRAVLAEVVAMVGALRELREQHVDVEWAADDTGVHLIQVRPLTASADQPRGSATPVAGAYRLYFDDLPADVHLGEVAGVYAGYIAKRAPAYRMAEANDVATGAGWVLQFNGRGLHDERSAAHLRDTLATGESRECVLDLGDTLRQIVLPKHDVLSKLAEVTGAAEEDSTLRAAVVRDFIRGELGVISRRAGAGAGLVVEYTPEGLMALNRGTAGGHTVVVSDLSQALDAPGNVTADDGAALLLPHLAELARLTTAMQSEHGEVTLEWVYSAGRLYFVDYSVLGADEVTMTTAGAVQISPGTARGPLLRLNEDEMLRRLSIGPAVSIDRSTDVAEYDGLAHILEKVAASTQPPIIHVSRPYAVLSILIGQVAGFVFDQGSTLGHLAILLREARVPAVATPGVTGSGEALISDGTVVLTGNREDRA